MQLTPFLSVWESPVSEARAVPSLMAAAAAATALLHVQNSLMAREPQVAGGCPIGEPTI